MKQIMRTLTVVGFFALFCNVTAQSIEACISSTSGTCTVQVDDWTLKVKNDPVEGRSVWVTGKSRSGSTWLFEENTALTFSCLNNAFDIRMDVYPATGGKSFDATWKYDNGPVHDRQTWYAQGRMYLFGYVPIPANSTHAFFEEGLVAEGSLTVRLYFVNALDAVFSTNGLPKALQAIHCM